MTSVTPFGNLKRVDTENDDDASNSLFGEEDNIEETTTYHKEDKSNSQQQMLEQVKKMEAYAKHETNIVNRWRRVIFVSILLGSFGIIALLAVVIHNYQNSNAKEAYALFANTIEDNFRAHVQSIFEASRTLSQAITSAAIMTNQTFPYVQVPVFEALANQAREAAGFEAIAYSPIVYNGEDWIKFSNQTRSWVDESKKIYDKLHYPKGNRSLEEPMGPLHPAIFQNPDPESIYFDWEDPNDRPELLTRDNTKANSGEEILPVYMFSPPPAVDGEFLNYDMNTFPDYRATSQAAVQLKDAVFSPFHIGLNHLMDFMLNPESHQEAHNANGIEKYPLRHPHSLSTQPVYKDIGSERKDVVGYIYSFTPWDTFLINLLPEGAEGILVVLKNTCGEAFTYKVTGRTGKLLGSGELVDPRHTNQRRSVTFLDNYLEPDLAKEVPGHCIVSLDVYPSGEFNEQYNSDLTTVFVIMVIFLFGVMALIFIMYDGIVQRRNMKVVGAAARSNAIVTSLFPANVADRLIAEKEQEEMNKNKKRNGSIQGFLKTERETTVEGPTTFRTEPLADLFPQTTILFADIVGFTAWSSVREPSKVFKLLETVFSSFDDIAKKRRVFKVETVGDCYVAVCGLPIPRKDHAVVMARFARDCMQKMWFLCREMERSLGPDTGDLSMRMGLHSGAVTAGVLRGERARFQLFGDTMNTASRMESTGQRGQIQISQETADLLSAGGKGTWFVPRPDAVLAKGKGRMSTYFLRLSSNRGSDTTSLAGSSDDEMDDVSVDLAPVERRSAAKMRLVDWNTAILLRLLKQIKARRITRRRRFGNLAKETPKEDALKSNGDKTVLDEVSEIISLPNFDEKCVETVDPDEVTMDETVAVQLRAFVQSVCDRYHDNPFHNFEHASHVTMSVTKLLSRIVAPSEVDANAGADACTMHDHTYGITSDPLTQFACTVSALIHDLDHPGIPNSQLVKENAPIATTYKGKSIAEQNSVDLAWSLLMSEEFSDLRSAIYCTDSELRRFRQLVVNSVMATDIVDRELKELRENRWKKAFYGEGDVQQDSEAEGEAKVAKDRKATIIIEHLIQASDVCHTMQHWHVYRKWNEKFFLECYRAYKEGRATVDPSECWYRGEIGFFDYYIIPLAKKLKNCGVFGVSCDEYLGYAIQNRNEWEQCGQEVVEELIMKAKALYPDTPIRSESDQREITA